MIADFAGPEKLLISICHIIPDVQPSVEIFPATLYLCKGPITVEKGNLYFHQFFITYKKSKNLFFTDSQSSIIVYMDIIDCHTHIFPPEVILNREKIITKDLRFAAIYKGSRERLIDARGLIEYMDDNNIMGCIACGFPFMDSGMLELSNDYIIEASRLDARIIPFIACDPYKRSWSNREIDRCYRGGARGIGEIGVYEKGLGKKEIRGLDGVVDAVEGQGLPIIIHVNEQIGHIYNGKISVDFASLTDFIKRHPMLKIILAHLGGGLCFYELMPEIKDAFRNVYYDTAALPFIYSAEIYSFIENFLSEKVLFGTDYPLLGPKRYIKAIESMEKKAQEDILSKNARRLLGRG